MIESIVRKYRVLVRERNERRHRQGAIVQARGLDRAGGISLLCDRAVSSSVSAGLEELSQPESRRTADVAGVRRSGQDGMDYEPLISNRS